MSTRGRCARCSHWKRLEYEADLPDGATAGEWGACTALEAQTYDSSFGAEVLAFTWDASGYQSGLTTRADFGCVNFDLAAVPTHPQKEHKNGR